MSSSSRTVLFWSVFTHAFTKARMILVTSLASALGIVVPLGIGDYGVEVLDE